MEASSARPTSRAPDGRVGTRPRECRSAARRGVSGASPCRRWGRGKVILVPAGSVLSQGRATMVSRSAISPIRDGRSPQVMSEMLDDHLTSTAPPTIIVIMTITVNWIAALRWVWFLPPANAVIAQSVVSNHGCATNLEESVLKRGQPRIRAARSGSVPRPSSREDRPWTTTTREISMT